MHKMSQKLSWNGSLLSLKSDSHVPENFCQIKVIPSDVQKNTINCLFGV